MTPGSSRGGGRRRSLLRSKRGASKDKPEATPEAEPEATAEATPVATAEATPEATPTPDPADDPGSDVLTSPDEPGGVVSEPTEDLGPEIPDKLFFRIGEVSELVGVEPHVLRYWESEFKMRPQRSTSGQRMYKRKDIARFVRIRRLLHEQGFTIAGARKHLSGDTQPAVAGGGDPSRIREALERIEALRGRIRDSRQRLSTSLGSLDAKGD